MTTDVDLLCSGRGFPCDHLSPSFISKFEQCPLAALYYREGRPKLWDPRYAEIGSYTHSIIEREYNPSAEIAHPEHGIDHMMATRHREAMEGYRWLREHILRLDPREGTQHPEVFVHTEVAGVPLIGYIDLLSIRGHQVYIDDWKTGLYKPQDEAQLRMYTMIISRTMGIPPRDIIATLDYLRHEPGRIQRQVPYTSTRAIEQHLIDDVITPIRDLQFVPVRGQHCGRCEYRHICEAIN